MTKAAVYGGFFMQKQSRTPHKAYGSLIRKQKSDDIVFLIRNVELFLGHPLDRVIDPLLAGIVCIDKTRLLTQHLISFS